MSEIGIVMAAGLGKRMMPLTEHTAKPLIKVHGVPMIESIIDGLSRRMVDKIYIIVGYKKEQFEYLKEKYDNVDLIANLEYKEKNNISSLKAAGEILGSEDCFICEADLYITDQEVFNRAFSTSCYFGKMVEGDSADWVFEVNDKRIVGIGIGGCDSYNMAGISYWKKADAVCIRKWIEEAYTQPGHEKLFWDEIVDRNINKLLVQIEPVQDGQIVELDTVEALERVNAHKLGE